MAVDFSKFENRIKEVKDWLSHEFSLIRTGRATPAILDGVNVEIYGSKQPIKHSASISIEGARKLKVVPWDKSQIPALEKAISDAGLGLSVSSDDKGVRVIFPELNEESRKNLVKIISVKLEEARVSVKREREELWHQISEDEKSNNITEDDKFRAKDDLQKKVDGANKDLDEMAKRKEGELMEQ